MSGYTVPADTLVELDEAADALIDPMEHPGFARRNLRTLVQLVADAAYEAGRTAVLSYDPDGGTLARQMADELVREFSDMERHRMSALNVSAGLGDRNGIIRLTVDDVGRTCARIAEQESRVHGASEQEQT